MVSIVGIFLMVHVLLFCVLKRVYSAACGMTKRIKIDRSVLMVFLLFFLTQIYYETMHKKTDGIACIRLYKKRTQCIFCRFSEESKT